MITETKTFFFIYKLQRNYSENNQLYIYYILSTKELKTKKKKIVSSQIKRTSLQISTKEKISSQIRNEMPFSLRKKLKDL